MKGNIKIATAFLIATLLLTLLIYTKSSRNDFVTWDDPKYVVENSLIRDLSLPGVENMFTTFYAGNYHPLTALSNAIEYQLYGLNPMPYHVINVVLHLLNV